MQLRLLDLQSLDVRIDQLDHRARTLPEHARIAELQVRINELQPLVVAAETNASDIAREQAKADSDVEQVRERAKRDQDRLDSGAITSPKELESLQHEIASLARRQAELEDTELEVMERLEDAQNHHATLVAEREQVLAEFATVTEARDTALAALAEEKAGLLADRGAVVPDIDDSLLGLYDKLRESSGGVGAAMLRQRRCEGCRLELNASDLVRIRAAEPEEVIRCEECRRILVRTAESGL